MLNQSDWQSRFSTKSFPGVLTGRCLTRLNRFRGREVKGSSIGILTDRSLVKMVNFVLMTNVYLGSRLGTIYVTRVFDRLHRKLP